MNREKQKRRQHNAAPGVAIVESLAVDAESLAIFALASGPGAESLRVDIRDPSGQLVATSVSALGRSLATAVPIAPGAYTVEVTNLSAGALPFELTLVERRPWLP